MTLVFTSDTLLIPSETKHFSSKTEAVRHVLKAYPQVSDEEASNLFLFEDTSSKIGYFELQR